MSLQQILARSHEKNLAATWDDAHRYTPMVRHRRLILKLLAGLDFADVLDASCAQPYLLEAVVSRFGVTGCGCDISDRVMAANQDRLPGCEFRALDLSHQARNGPLDARGQLVARVPDRETNGRGDVV